MQCTLFNELEPDCIFRIKKVCNCKGKCEKFIDSNGLEGIKIREKYGANPSDSEKIYLRKRYKLKPDCGKDNIPVNDKIHTLKILPEYYKAVLFGDKTFEIRKNDRDYKVGDRLYLREFNGKDYTGNVVNKTITYILAGGNYGLEKDYVILAIK